MYFLMPFCYFFDNSLKNSFFVVFFCDFLTIFSVVFGFFSLLFLWLPWNVNIAIFLSIYICKVSTYLYHHISYLSHSFFFMYSVSSVVESLQMILINSCSVNSYILGVLKGGGELSVLLCHLGHFLPTFTSKYHQLKSFYLFIFCWCSVLEISL